MQTGNTSGRGFQPRKKGLIAGLAGGAAGRGAVLKMADGGMISALRANLNLNRLVGNNPAAMAARGRSADGSTPPTPAPAPPAPTGGGTVTPENPAGIRFADGGRVMDQPYANGSPNGGRVVGKGGPVDDTVPAAYSPGEYVLPADTAAAVGHGKLDQLRAATHTPAALQRKGMIRRMADGGVNPDVVSPAQSAINSQAMSDNSAMAYRPMMASPQFQAPAPTLRMADGGMNLIPTDGYRKAPAPDGSQDSVMNSSLGRNITNTLSALPGAAPALGAIGALAGASRVMPAATGVIGNMARAAAPVAPFVPPVAGATALMAASSPAIPASTPATPAPATQTDAQRGGAATVTPVATPDPSPPPNDYSSLGNPSARTNNITRVGNSYSGGNVGGDITINGQPPRNGGVISAMNMAAAQALSDRYQAQANRPTQDEVITAANIRDGVNPDRGTSSDPNQNGGGDPGIGNFGHNSWVRQHVADQANQTALRGQDLQAQQQGAIQKLAQQKWGTESVGVGLDNQLKSLTNDTHTNLLNAQRAYLGAAKAGDIKAMDSARAQMMALAGGVPAPAFEAVSSSHRDVMGNVDSAPAGILNKQTGILQPIAGSQLGNQPTGQVQPDANHVAYLKANATPEVVAQFDAKYGQGAAAKIIGKK